ncbi:Lipase 5, variant 3 [Entomophthora muscae]|uniref:Lipase 5, variant 3 n=1 Tax=Entomophthora muscae TaxID=34485 RepID=A0ACC2UB21_9FUNG|nr:Lipase 5, variant 3 [Entomophthora muscae]
MPYDSEPECKLYDFTKSSRDKDPPQNKKHSQDLPHQGFLQKWLGVHNTSQSYVEQFNSIKLSAGQAIYDKIICSPHLIEHYYSIMRLATSYERWSTAAAILDQLEGKEDWKKDPISPDYDYELILTRLGQLQKARIEKDYASMIYLMSTSLSRNFGDVGKMQLFSHTHIGTKTLIEAYSAEVAKILNMIGDAETSALDLPSKYEFFLNTRKAFGRTALLLSGGATLGLNHLGVCRALSQAKLLPRIISGASSGSIIAALVCTNNDDELERILTEGNINMSAFEAGSRRCIIMSSLSRLLKTGVLFDTQILVECIKGLTGNYTFQEAYNKTRRTLNIPVSSSTVYEMPSLLNYMTAPNVLIWSAVAASCSVPLVFDSNSIYAKDRNGKIVPWNPTGSRWIDGSVESDLPMNKLAEMFNVNHFIVCQVNPHVVPFLEKSAITSQKSKVLDWTMSLAKSELQHRLQQLGELGVMKSFVYRMQNILSQKYVGDITIVPDISYSDFTRIFTNPSQEDVIEAVSRGEKALWPSKLYYTP